MWTCIKSGLHSVSTLGYYSKPSIGKSPSTCCMTLFPKENWTRIAGLLGAAAVGSANMIRPNYYHFLHTLGLAVVPLSKRPILTGTLMLLGTTLFSGTIYYNIFYGKRQLKEAYSLWWDDSHYFLVNYDLIFVYYVVRDLLIALSPIYCHILNCLGNEVPENTRRQGSSPVNGGCGL
ncbi:unnamed protein product [Lepeophtheirus salmonis]|uniref:(salmon louse) hypothetical protein n=1 Tax=Lepeophtheirus salmonis TaxID=72036 RepID=A0A7R8CBT3_LEPSM|nr:unnamed protein product [Lepeophtheirus salmonis]CAF2763767.1 unnamed protein product [Lepeophtheirus salmonis]